MDATVIADTCEETWQAAQWYRALSLTERRELDKGLPGAPYPVPPDGGKRAASRLAAWKAQKPFDDGSTFGRRLAADGLSESHLLAHLREPTESLQDRVPAVPAWLDALRSAYADPDAFEPALPVLARANVDHTLAGCLPALGPVLQRGLSRLDETLETLRRRYGQVPVDPTMVAVAFVREIAPDVLYQLSKPLILELHIARLEGRLLGETPEARFNDFARRLSDERAIVPLLAKYPVLARQLVTTVDNWAAYVAETLVHLCADWEEIRTTFTPGVDTGAVVEIEGGLGDRHRGGRSVLLLRFASGLRLLHKPKSLAVDAHFQDLLAWLNERGADPPLRPLKLVDRGEYGWSEFVQAAPCGSRDEVARFFQRQGSYLALMYALGGVDLHNENVIAAGEHPMFIDLEALFHPHVHSTDPLLTGNPAASAMDQSVWQVGMLPRRLWSDAGSAGVDMSGLGGGSGQLMPHPLVRWQGAGSDEMRVARERILMPVSENRPKLGDQEVDVLDHRHALLTGFTRMYRLLCRHRDVLLAEQVPRFAHDPIRVVVRSTNVYATLLYESFHPDILRDALDRDRYLDRLWIDVPRRPRLAGIIAAERRDLLRGDIPLFTTIPASRAAFTSEGEPILDFLETASLDLVQERIERLSEEDLTKQIWIIEASLATLLMDREDAMGSPLGFDPVPEPVPRDRLLEMATEVGDRLEALALQNDVGAYWLGVGPVDDFNWELFPTGTDLYSGSSGIAFFLAYLGSVTGDPRYARLAGRALASLRTQVEALAEDGGHPSVGGFDGAGSLIYLFTHLGALWCEPSLLDQAEEIARALPPLISRDDRLDLIYGSAGCLLALLALHTVRPSSCILEAATQCGDRLLAAGQPMPEGIGWTTLKDQQPLGGFSHGAAGMAYSLLQLWAASGEMRFHEAALAALAFDRSLYVPELGNWKDVRVFPARPGSGSEDKEEPGSKSMVAWCHGAPGIGLGRLAALGLMDDGLVRAEIDIALRTTVQHGFVSNHSLCHGALGNTDLLLMAAQVLGRPRDREALDRAVRRNVGSIAAHGMVTGVPLGIETPGLMSGLGGIGYELLRLAEPDRVPSVLVLAPPTSGIH